MAMVHEDRIRELFLRYLTSWPTSHLAADNAAWAAGVKIRAIDIDVSGLEGKSEPDASRQSDIYSTPANHPTLRSGNWAFSTYLGGGHGGASAGVIATLLSKFAGGLDSADTRSLQCTTGSDSDTLKITSHGLVVGQGVLVGARGDSKGEGEVRWIKTVTDTDTVELNMALQGSPAENDYVYVADTVYCDDPATQTLIAALILGEDVTSPDQIQTYGDQGSFELDQIDPGQLAVCKFNLTTPDFQDVPIGNVASLSPSTALDGEDPDDAYLGQGGFFMADADKAASVARKALRVEQCKFNSGIAHTAVGSRNGINGVQAFRRTPERTTFECLAPFEDDTDLMPGMVTNWSARTAQEVIIQSGCELGKCWAIGMQSLYLDIRPVRTPAGAWAAVRLQGHADQYLSGATALAKSRFWIWTF